MTIAQFHTDVMFLINKSQGGYYAPEQIDDAADTAQMGIFATYVDQSKDDNYAHSALDPFRQEFFFQASNFAANGVLNLPAGYMYTTGMYANYFDNATGNTNAWPLKEYRNDEIPDALRSQVRPVTASTPFVAKKGTNAYQFYPRVTQNGYINYISRPIRPLFSYTQVGRVITQNVGASIDPQWDDSYIKQVVLKTLEILGINLSSGDLVQYSQGKLLTAIQTPDKP